MPYKPKSFNPLGDKHKKERRRLYDKERGTAAERGPYCTKWWKDTRRRIAIRDLYECQECGRDVGLRKGDFHCDHIEERPVGAAIDAERWDRDENLRTLCASCHNARTAKDSRR